MQHLIDAVRDAIVKESWYPALTLALVMPDACSALEHPAAGVGVRYKKWVDTYFAPFVTENERTYLSGDELYLLRCRFLHQGEFRLSQASPSHPDNAEAMFEVLNHVQLFVSDDRMIPSRGIAVDSPTSRRTSYGVGVKDLCEWICRAAESWLAYVRADAAMFALLEEWPRIIKLENDMNWTRL
jgi:hypothetical protein